MAVILNMTYQKKLGLPNYSSHGCSASLTIEIPDVSVAAEQFSNLYQLLQASVDKDIQKVGFMPDATTYGMNHHTNPQSQTPAPQNGNGNGDHAPARKGESWNCTEGQKGLILRLINEQKLDKQRVEDQAQGLFGVGVKELDKMQASQLIDELLETSGRKPTGQRRWNRQPART